MTVLIDGAQVDVYNRIPSENAHEYVRKTMARVGAQIQSSQWVGWVPSGNCPGGGDLGSPTFSVRNIRVSGEVVQGSKPAACSGPPSPTPPAPTPPSPPSPTCPSQAQCGCSGLQVAPNVVQTIHLNAGAD